MPTFKAYGWRSGSGFESLADPFEDHAEIRRIDVVPDDGGPPIRLHGFNPRDRPKVKPHPRLVLDIPCLFTQDSALTARLDLESDLVHVRALVIDAAFPVEIDWSRVEDWQQLKPRRGNQKLYRALGLDIGGEWQLQVQFPVDTEAPVACGAEDAFRLPRFQAKVARDDDDSQLWLFGRHLTGMKPTQRLFQLTDADGVCRSPRPDLMLIVDDVPWTPGRQLWNAFVDSYSNGLDLASGHPASFVPRIEPRADEGAEGDTSPSWRAVYRVRDRSISERGDTHFHTLPTQPGDGGSGQEANGAGDDGEKSNPIESIALNLSGEAELSVSFPLVRAHGGAPLAGRMRVVPPTFDVQGRPDAADDPARMTRLWNESSQQGLVLQRIEAVRSAGETHWERRVRMGALDVVLAEVAPALEEAGHVQVRPGVERRGSMLNPIWVSTAVEGVDSRLSLALETIEAGSQDQVEPLGGDCRVDDGTSSVAEFENRTDEEVDCLFARRPSLVIGGQLGSPNSDGSPSLHLEVCEKTEPRRTLQLKVRRPDNTQGESSGVQGARSRAIILDPDPFLVALVGFPALFSDEFESTVATWKYDGFGAPVWRFRLEPNQKIELQLPPQAVGEEMERYRNVDSGKLLDFRFSPPAKLDFRESIRAREYAVAPWNVRQLFGDDRAELPGVVVESMEYELVYGLACKFPHSEAAGALGDEPLLRMADVFALAGPAPGPLPARLRWSPAGEFGASARRSYQRARGRWARTYDQLQARLGMFEAWNPYAAPSLSRRVDVECRIRSTATLATAADDCGGDLLCGGVLYGIEQPAVYSQLQGPQEDQGRLSDRARVDGLALSSLGGWGHQTATFGVMTVIAEVGMGRTQTLRIEVLGRIACTWNRARHVVVYERTPAPSRQLVCYQNAHLRRPVLRKTQEFVEILQPRREYPDSEVANPRFTGPVRACEFEEGAKFNVLSFWGETVGEHGWKIPIWRRGQLPSDLYPEPVVTLAAAASVDGERREQPCVVDNPEDVYFYTEFSDRGSDPDLWPPIVEIECIDASDERPRQDFASGKVETRSLADVAVPRGFARCSFRLKPLAHGVDLTAERAAKTPVGAHLSTLTFSRGLLPPGSEPAKGVRAALASALREGGGAANTVTEVREAVTAAQRQLDEFSFSDLETSLGALWAEESQRVEELLGLTGGESSGLLAEVERRLDQWAGNALDEETAEVEAAADMVADALRERVARIGGAAAGAQRAVNGWLARARGELAGFRRAVSGWRETSVEKRAQLRVTDSLRLAIQGLGATLALPLRLSKKPDPRFEEQVEASLPTALALLSDDAREELEALLAWVKGSADAADEWLDECLETVDALAAEIDGLAEGLDQRLKEIQGHFDDLVDDVEKKAEQALRQIFAAGTGKVTELVDVMRQRLRGQVEESWDEIRGPVERIAGVAIVQQERFNAAKRQVRSAYGQVLEDLRGGDPMKAIESAQQGLAAMAGFVEELEANVQVVADNGLRLVRAFGKPPEVEGLAFSRPEIAYFFDEASDAVGLTPVIARAQQVSAVADALKPLGVDLPAVALTDQVVSAPLENFDLSSILPNVAGIDFEGLFPSLKMPDDGDVHVRHGIDPESRRAWLEATFDVEQPGRHELFSTSGLCLFASSPVLTGKARVEVAADGSLRRETEGRMSSTWELAIGGRSLIRFVETVVTFDGDGNFQFDFAPERIELDATLQFVQKFLSGLLPGDPPVRVEPTGVVAELFLPVPNVSGAFAGINNLTLGCQFALRFFPEFAIEAGFNLAKPEAPFTLTIFILGGAGYVTATTRYTPLTAKASTHLDMAIAVSASLSLALGPIEGGVFVYLGLNARYSDGSRGGLLVAFFILIRGHVSVLGIASATITLRLEASYDQSGDIQGTGTISIRIKICWCFTLKVKKSVTYKLGKVGGERSSELGLPGETVRLARAGDGSWALPGAQAPRDPTHKTIFHQRVAEYLDMVA